MKASKTMRTSRPARSSAGRAEKKGQSGDSLKLRLIELCDQAAASVAKLRRLDLTAMDPEAFGEAYAGLMEAGYYCQGIEEALVARVKVNEAIREVEMLDDDGPNSWAMGLTKCIVGDARAKLALVRSRAERERRAKAVAA